MAAHQAPPSLGFSRQGYWSGLPFPSPMHESEKWKWSHSVVSNSSRPHGLQPTRLLHPWDFPGKSTGVGCHCLLRFFGWRSPNSWHHLTLWPLERPCLQCSHIGSKGFNIWILRWGGGGGTILSRTILLILIWKYLYSSLGKIYRELCSLGLRFLLFSLHSFWSHLFFYSLLEYLKHFWSKDRNFLKCVESTVIISFCMCV